MGLYILHGDFWTKVASFQPGDDPPKLGIAGELSSGIGSWCHMWLMLGRVWYYIVCNIVVWVPHWYTTNIDMLYCMLWTRMLVVQVPKAFRRKSCGEMWLAGFLMSLKAVVSHCECASGAERSRKTCGEAKGLISAQKSVEMKGWQSDFASLAVKNEYMVNIWLIYG